jgi:hypothetical protein
MRPAIGCAGASDYEHIGKTALRFPIRRQLDARRPRRRVASEEIDRRLPDKQASLDDAEVCGPVCEIGAALNFGRERARERISCASKIEGR